MSQQQPLLGFLMLVTRYAAVLLFAWSPLNACPGAIVDDTAALVAAFRDGGEGATIEIAAGTYELDANELFQTTQQTY